MNHTCKNCGFRVTIPEQWILEQKNQKIQCEVCGKKVILNIEKYVSTKVDQNLKSKTGTVVAANRNLASLPTSYQLIISNRHTNETLAIKQVYPNKTYIVGRNATKIKSTNPNAEPILIPTQFDPAVSRVHFELTLAPKQNLSEFIIKDLESLHKTKIINRQNAEEVLKANEQVMVGYEDKIVVGQNTLIYFSQVQN